MGSAMEWSQTRTDAGQPMLEARARGYTLRVREEGRAWVGWVRFPDGRIETYKMPTQDAAKAAVIQAAVAR